MLGRGSKLRFLSLKKVPLLSWSSPKALTLKPPFLSAIILMIGLIIFGLGEALLIAAGIGVSPWTVLAQGLANITEWSIGFATFIVSLCVLICWIPLKQTPGVGTILNAIIIALVLDYCLPYIPTFDGVMSRTGQAISGVLVTGLPVNSDYSNTSLEKIIYDMQTWKKIRMIGSAAMASCYIATGKAEMYKEKGVYLWDILAGAAIVESAGGIADISNIRENFQVDVVFSNSHIKD